MLTEIPEVWYIRYMRSYNSGDIHGEKTAPQLLGHIELQNVKVKHEGLIVHVGPTPRYGVSS